MRFWLKEKRKTFGFSQRKIAILAAISPQYYNYIENGERNPPVWTAKKIANVLSFDWRLFYPDEEVGEVKEAI